VVLLESAGNLDRGVVGSASEIIFGNFGNTVRVVNEFVWVKVDDGTEKYLQLCGGKY
jgi:hypothetical protein